MRSLEVDHDSPVPVYRQISDGLRGLIAQGALVDGEELPSVRELAARVGVNLNTVARAYRILADEGLVDLRHGSGARVRRPEPIYRAAASPPSGEVDRSLRDLLGRLVLAGLDRADIERRLLDAVEEFFRKPSRS